jgi:hypothetical protein
LRDGEVLPQAGKIHEAQIDGTDFLGADQGQDFFGTHGARTSYQGGNPEVRRDGY